MNKKTEKRISLMNSLLIVFSVTVLMLLLCSCGKKQEEEPVIGMPNPIHECTEAELGKATGISLSAPDGASDAKYCYIGVDDTAISQVTFSLDGKKYCYRAQPTSCLSIEANVDENASGKDLSSALSDCTNIGAALAGMYYKWECVRLIDITEREAVVAFNEGKEGFVAWLDVVPGILYSLSMENGASQNLLIDSAEACFVPLQGEAG